LIVVSIDSYYYFSSKELHEHFRVIWPGEIELSGFAIVTSSYFFKVGSCRTPNNKFVAGDVKPVDDDVFWEVALLLRAVGRLVERVSCLSRLHEFLPCSVFSVLCDLCFAVWRGIADENEHVDILLNVDMTIKQFYGFVTQSTLTLYLFQEGAKSFEILLELRGKQDFIAAVVIAIDDDLDDERALDAGFILQVDDAGHDESDLPDELLEGLLHGAGAVDTDDDLYGCLPSYLHPVQFKQKLDVLVGRVVETLQVALGSEMVPEALFQLHPVLGLLRVTHLRHVLFQVVLDIVLILADYVLLHSLAFSDYCVNAALLTLPGCPALELNEF
jgi:hypothetical protein